MGGMTGNDQLDSPGMSEPTRGSVTVAVRPEAALKLPIASGLRTTNDAWYAVRQAPRQREAAARTAVQAQGYKLKSKPQRAAFGASHIPCTAEAKVGPS